MDEKTKKAIRSNDWDRALEEFVNLEDSERAQEFAERFGDLLGSRVPLDRVSPSNYLYFVDIFRRVWRAKTKEEKSEAGKLLGNVFNRYLSHIKVTSKGYERPGVDVDFARGRVTPKAEVLLDRMAVIMLARRRSLAICKLKTCRRFFVKKWPNDKHCSDLCAGRSRVREKRNWWRENRGKDWKERKTRKQSVSRREK
jgi:hypothetical protein